MFQVQSLEIEIETRENYQNEEGEGGEEEEEDHLSFMKKQNWIISWVSQYVKTDKYKKTKRLDWKLCESIFLKDQGNFQENLKFRECFKKIASSKHLSVSEFAKSLGSNDCM